MNLVELVTEIETCSKRLHDAVNAFLILRKSEMDDLALTDDQAAAVAKTPNRISLESIKNRILHTEYIYPYHAQHMTICVLALDNGFALVGQSAPADPKNFNHDLGRQFAFEDALRRAWPLEAYLLREKMSAEENAAGHSKLNPDDE